VAAPRHADRRAIASPVSPRRLRVHRDRADELDREARDHHGGRVQKHELNPILRAHAACGEVTRERADAVRKVL